jgi:signal transduction histidine kinase
VASAGVLLAARERQAVRALTRDNPSQQARVGIVGDLTQQIIERRGVQTAPDVIRAGRGDPLLGEFRAVARDMEHEERRLLDLRNADTERGFRRARVALSFGSTLALLIAAVAGWLVPRAYTALQRAQTALLSSEERMRVITGAHDESGKVLGFSEISTNSELEAFSYSVSHDLRAPLRSIDGFSKLLLDDHAGALDAKGKDYLLLVRASAQRMGELIDDLLLLSRVGGAGLVRDRVDLSSISRGAATQLRRKDPDRQVTICIEEPLSVEADDGLMRVLLENLLGNAWKFTANVPAARIEVGTEQKEGGPVFFVRDNGAGFDMSYAEKLFSPFQRLHTEAQFPGTGIGLATVHRIVGRHGGRIWADSVVDQGATFYFTIPPASSGRQR